MMEKIVGSRPSDRPVTHSPGRLCRSDGCETLLSRYNADEVCGAHQQPPIPRLRRASSTRGAPNR